MSVSLSITCGYADANHEKILQMKIWLQNVISKNKKADRREDLRDKSKKLGKSVL